MEINLGKETAVVTDYSQLRYNLLYRINRMHLRRRAAIRRAVCLSTHTSQTSYYVFLNLKKDDKRDMDATVLRAFAKALNIDMELLFND